MKILAIDTSSSYLSLAISDGDRLIYEINKDLKKKDHAKLLIPELKSMLEKVNFKLNDIDVFCVGLGPGSFTGLRVAISSVKGLNFACNKKILGISSMDAIAYNINNKNNIIVCIQDARKKKVYGCLYKKENDELIRLTDYLLLAFDKFCDLIKKIARREKRKVIFTADGVKTFKDDILAAIPDALFAQKIDWRPYARNLAELSLEMIKNNKPFSSIDEIEPLYLHSQYASITKPKKL